MRNSLRCVLDLEGLSQVPENYTLVETETALWQAFIGTESIWVRGNSALISWAAKALAGRGWEIQTKSNEYGPLLEKFPYLAPHITEVARRIGNSDEVGSIGGMARSILPGVPTEDLGTAKHLLNYLIWDLEQDLDLSQQAVRRALIESWAAQQDGDIAYGYERLIQESPDSHLKEWMALGSETRHGKWVPFPNLSEEASLPLSQIIGNSIRSLLLSGNSERIREFFRSDAAPPVKSIATRVVGDALKRNPEVLALDMELANILVPFASSEISDLLLKLIPPPLPGKLPDTFTDLPNWYQKEYLPYRQWTALTNEATGAESLHDTWRTFSLWYLERLLAAINGGKGESQLAFKMVRDLWRRAEDSPVLLIILDGLLPGDERDIADQIRKRNPDWEVTGKTFAAALVPTITEICKVSLIQGCPPLLSQNNFREIRSRTEAIAATRSAVDDKKGYVIWASNEPDWTYHKKFDTPEITRYEVSKEISSIVSDISSLLSEIPKDSELNVVITSDHGRTIGGCPRRLAIPKGANSHDRVAQVPGQFVGNDSFYVDENDVIHVNEEAFGVGTGTSLISSTDLVFSPFMSGEAWYVHGGIMPEEAIVPWLTLARVKTETIILGKAILDGILGRPCRLSLELSNPSDVGLEPKRVRMQGRGLVPVAVDVELPQVKPLGSLVVDLTVLIEGDGIVSPDLLVEVSKPSGELLSFNIPLSVNLRAMQDRSVDLNEDFD